MADLDPLVAVLDACAAGSIPPNVALMRLITIAESEAEIDAALCQGETRNEPLIEIRRLWATRSQAFRTVSAIHRLGTQPPDSCCDWSAIFDSAAALNPHAAVALYCLGDPELLRRATGEIVMRLREWGVLDRAHAVLDFGCGTGRVAIAIAPFVQRVVALDASPEMVRLARAASAALANVEVTRAGDLSGLTQRYDAVLAIDSMPYVVQSGHAEELWGQIADSLRPHGVWAIFNYSYRGDVETDQEEIVTLADRFGFAVERNGTTDFRLWDARTFLLRNSGNAIPRI